mgnify:CR=1 FL=1
MKVNTSSYEYIVNKYKNLVYKLARRLNLGKVDYDDLVQAGFMGLLAACNNFDFTKNTNFISYATYYIISEIKKENRKSSIYKTSDYIQKLKNKINKYDNLTIEEIARKVNTSVENVMLVKSLNYEVISFNDIEECYPSPRLNFIELILTKEELEVYKLKVINKYSQKEISKTLNISQSTVSRRLKELENKIKKDGLYN